MPLSDGGSFSNGPQIQFNPPTLDFGAVKVGNSATLALVVKNIGDQNCHMTAIALDDPQFTQDLSLPASIPYGGGQRVIHVTFTPTVVAPVAANLTVTSDSVGNPDVLPLAGQGFVGGKLLSISPSSWDFGSQKDGVASAEKIFTLTNSGDVGFVITLLGYNGDFSAGPTQPTLPHGLSAGATVDVGVIFTPSVSGFRQYTNGLVIISDAIPSPANVQLSGTGYAIIPAFTLTGAVIQPIVGFALDSSVDVKAFDPTSLDSEEISTIERVYEFGEPGTEETMLRLMIHYENLGIAAIHVSASTTQQSLAPVTVNLGNVAADGKLYTAFADLVISGEFINIRIDRIKGPVSITRLTPRIVDRGEVVPK